MKTKPVLVTLVNLYQLATAEDIVDGETDEPITLKKFQEMLKDEVLEMGESLGVKIEREAPHD